MNRTTTNHSDQAADAPPFMPVVLLRIEDAARALAIGRTTMYELVATGEIPVVRIGRSTRVPVTALDEFVTRRRSVRATFPSPENEARAERQLDPGRSTT
jgi:excisionase family DNA binding protein